MHCIMTTTVCVKELKANLLKIHISDITFGYFCKQYEQALFAARGYNLKPQLMYYWNSVCFFKRQSQHK